MKCPKCEAVISWDKVNSNGELASDASFWRSEFTCPQCEAWLLAYYDLAALEVQEI